MPDPVVPTPTTPPAPAPAPVDVPEWLDPQFVVRDASGVFDVTASAQKQAASYKELHATYTRTTQTPPADPTKVEPPAEPKPPTEPVTPEPTEADTPITRATSYYEQHGKLDDAQYAELETAGISRAMVDQYIAGQVAAQSAYNTELFNAAGGQPAYEAAITWAAANLSPAEVAAYDAVIETGNAEQAKLAVAGLMSKHVAAVGRSPAYVEGGGAPGTGAVGFRSQAEIRAAMSDPKYKVDSAYRNDVARRLQVTPDNIT